MNCGVIQGFAALRKAVNTHVKKYRILSRVLIQQISRTCHWRHSIRLMNERQSLLDSQYKFFVGTFSNHAGKTLKYAYRQQTVRFKLS